MTNAADERRIGGRYRLRQPLGSGAHGRVFLADDLVGGAVVAVKRAEGAEFVLALQREFAVLSRLRHPNILGALDFGRNPDAEEAWLVLEHVDGAPLDRLERPGPEDAADLLAQACRGLGYLHDRGFVHGDVKPSNLLVARRPGGRLWLTVIDLGLAIRDGEGEEGVLRGTPRFAAPSVLRGEPPTPRGDLYSLGLCFRLLLTGSAELGEGADESLAPELGPVLRRLTREDQDARYSRADLVVEELLRLVPVLRRREEGVFRIGVEAVGRDEELSRLDAWLARTLDTDEAGPFLSIRGAAGTGKSRLLDELGLRALQRGATVGRAACLPGVPSPYEPLRGLLDHLALILDHARPEVASELRAIEEQLHGTRAARAGRVGDEGEIAALHLRLRRGLEAAAESGPILLRLDDLHWADTSTASFLRFLDRTRGPRGVAIAVASRAAEDEESRPALESGRATSAETITLDPLGAVDAALLAASILGARAGTPEVVSRIAESTQGHPGFVESAARAWMRERRRESARDLETTIHSWTPRYLLAAHDERLRSLPDASRRLAEELSVLTRGASTELIAAHSELSSGELPAAVDVLLEAGLLTREARGGVGTFRLDGESLRRFVLESLPEERRVELHRRAAAAWIRVLARPEDWSELLVEHFLAAGDPDGALRHGSIAVRRHVARQLFGEAIELAERLVALEPSAEVELALRESLGDAFAGAGRLRRARAAFARCRELGADASGAALDAETSTRVLRKLGAADIALDAFESARGHLEEARTAPPDGSAPEERARVLEFLAIAEYRLGRVSAAKARLEEGLGILEGGGERAAVADLWNDLGIIEYRLGNYDLAARHHRRALRIRDAAGNLDGQSRSLTNLANVALALGDDRSAREDYEASLAIKRRLGNVQSIAVTLANLGLLDYRTGRLGSAIARLEEAGRRQREVSDVNGWIRSFATLGEIWSDKGEPSRAERLVRAAVRVAREKGHRESTLVDALASRAAVLISLGRFASAIEVAVEGLEVATAEGLRPDESTLLGLRGEARHLEGDDAASAAADLRRSIEIARTVSDAHRLVRCVLAEGERALDRGEHALAASCAHEVRELASARPVPLLEARGLVLAGRLALEAGDPDAASSRLHQALAIGEKGDAPEIVWLACAALGEFHEAHGRTRRALHWLKRCVGVLQAVVGRIPEAAAQNAYLHHPRRARAVRLLERVLNR